MIILNWSVTLLEYLPLAVCNLMDLSHIYFIFVDFININFIFKMFAIEIVVVKTLASIDPVVYQCLPKKIKLALIFRQ